MNNNTKETIFIALIAVATFLVVFWALLKLSETLRIPNCKKNESVILVSDRIDQCKSQGGEYRLYYSDVQEQYVDSCDKNSEIELK